MPLARLRLYDVIGILVSGDQGTQNSPKDEMIDLLFRYFVLDFEEDNEKFTVQKACESCRP